MYALTVSERVLKHIKHSSAYDDDAVNHPPPAPEVLLSLLLTFLTFKDDDCYD